MRQSVVMLRGGSASGKTVVAERLRDLVEDVAWVHIDGFKRSFPGYPKKESKELHELGVLSTEYFLQRKNSVVVDSLFKNPDWIGRYKNLAEEYGANFKVIELLVDPKVAVERDQKRAGVIQGWREPIKPGHIRESLETIIQNPDPSAVPINTNQLTEDEVVEKIIETVGWTKKSVLKKAINRLLGRS